MGQPFGEAELQVVGHVFRNVVESLQLYADVLQRDRGRKVGIRVVIVQSDVHGQRGRRVFGVPGVKHFERGAAGPAVVEQVSVARRDGDVLGRKAADDVARVVRLVHCAITEVVGLECGGMALAESLDEGRANLLTARRISHEIQA